MHQSLLLLALCVHTALSQQLLFDYNAPPHSKSLGWMGSIGGVYEEESAVYMARVFSDPRTTELVKVDTSTGQTLSSKVLNGVEIQSLQPFSSASLIASSLTSGDDASASSSMIDLVNMQSLATNSSLVSISKRITSLTTLPNSQDVLVQTMNGAGTELQVLLPDGTVKWSTPSAGSDMSTPFISQDGKSILMLDAIYSTDASVKRLSVETGALLETVQLPQAYFPEMGTPFLSSRSPFSTSHGYVYTLVTTVSNATTNETQFAMTRYNDSNLSDTTQIMLPSDWTISKLACISENGSMLLAYGTDTLSAYDLTKGEQAVLLWTVGAKMDGYSHEDVTIYATQTQVINLERDPITPGSRNALLVFRSAATGQLEGMYRIVDVAVSSLYVNEDASRIYLKGLSTPQVLVISNPRDPVEQASSASAAVSLTFWTMAAAVVSGLLLVV